MRVLVDYHHTSLLHSLVYLFEGRLGFEVYRPIGLEWYTTGNWNIFPALDTAKQYLSLEQGYRPIDGTRPLNQLGETASVDGIYHVKDADSIDGFHKACTYDYFMNNDFDIVIASIPNHVAAFERLAKLKGAKFIVQAGNEWTIQDWRGYNVLASLAPRPLPSDVNAIFYHQEFPESIFSYRPPVERNPVPRISSFVNVYQHNSGWGDFTALERATQEFLTWKSYGGQCRNGAIDGYANIADEMENSEIIFHVKGGGDGYGHVLHNAFAIGRPVITRRSHYRGQWGGELFTDVNCIDLDRFRRVEHMTPMIIELAYNDDFRKEMGLAARRRFEELVNFEAEASAIERWIDSL